MSAHRARDGGDTPVGDVRLFAACWSQTSVRGHPGSGPEAVVAGRAWHWSGPAVQLGRVAAGGATLRGGFTVSDGARHWRVHAVPGGRSGWLAVFDDLPPRRRPLAITACTPPMAAARPAGHAGLAPGTPVETPRGPVAAEALRPGDAVLTDRGPLPVRAARLLLGAGGLTLPAGLFGPEGPTCPLTLGRGVWLGLAGQAISAAFLAREAALRAGDLEMLPGVRPAPSAPLVALCFDGAPLIMAGGLACLAGPPRAAPLRTLTEGEAQIALAARAIGLAPATGLRGAA
jgi:hypothetical protein